MSDEMAAVVERVSRGTGVPVAALLGRSRTRRVSDARFIAFYILHRQMGFTSLEVAAAFGRNHSTVLHGCMMVDEWLANPKLNFSAIGGWLNTARLS